MDLAHDVRLLASGEARVLVDRAFSLDINVRESAVLGLVGAGGIGMVLDAAMNLFQWDRVALILIAIAAVVVVAEIVVTQVRRFVI